VYNTVYKLITENMAMVRNFDVMSENLTQTETIHVTTVQRRRKRRK
jgi:hypothetical protein